MIVMKSGSPIGLFWKNSMQNVNKHMASHVIIMMSLCHCTWTLKQYVVSGMRPLTSAVKLSPLYSCQRTTHTTADELSNLTTTWDVHRSLNLLSLLISISCTHIHTYLLIKQDKSWVVSAAKKPTQCFQWSDITRLKCSLLLPKNHNDSYCNSVWCSV